MGDADETARHCPSGASRKRSRTGPASPHIADAGHGAGGRALAVSAGSEFPGLRSTGAGRKLIRGRSIACSWESRLTAIARLGVYQGDKLTGWAIIILQKGYSHILKH